MPCKTISPMELWFRIFPSIENDEINFKILQEEKSVLVRRIAEFKSIFQKDSSFLKFKANGIFQNVSQEKIFMKVLNQNLLHKLYEGLDLIIFVFGSSGTGKSFTVSRRGPNLEVNIIEEHRGLVPRFLETLFDLKEIHKGRIVFKISIKFVELSGKSIYNLLLEGKPRGSCQVESMTVENLEEALNALSAGEGRRNIQAGSHSCSAVLSLSVEFSCKSSLRQELRTSQIHFVEMAGHGGLSEGKKSEYHSDGNLTKSFLSTLTAWSDGGTLASSNSGVPSWRSSLLAFYLGSDLSKSYIRLLGHIKITKDAIASTISTLDFANRLMGNPKPLTTSLPSAFDKDVQIKRLEEELQNAKGIHTMNEILNGIYTSELFSKADRASAIRLVQLYLDELAKSSELTEQLNPVLILHAFRIIYKRNLKGLYEKIRIVCDEIEKLKLSKKKRDADSYEARSLFSIGSGSRVKQRKKKKKEDDDDISGLSVVPTKEEKRAGVVPTGTVIALNAGSLNAGVENYRTFQEEFLNRFPHFRLKMNALQEEANECSRVRANMMNYVERMTDELRLFESEPLKWRRETADSSWEIEEVPSEGRLEEARGKALLANRLYLQASAALSQYKRQLETHVIDYAIKTYDTTLIIIPLEDA